MNFKYVEFTGMTNKDHAKNKFKGYKKNMASTKQGWKFWDCPNPGGEISINRFNSAVGDMTGAGCSGTGGTGASGGLSGGTMGENYDPDEIIELDEGKLGDLAGRLKNAVKTGVQNIAAISKDKQASRKYDKQVQDTYINYAYQCLKDYGGKGRPVIFVFDSSENEIQNVLKKAIPRFQIALGVIHIYTFDEAFSGEAEIDPFLKQYRPNNGLITQARNATSEQDINQLISDCNNRIKDLCQLYVAFKWNANTAGMTAVSQAALTISNSTKKVFNNLLAHTQQFYDGEDFQNAFMPKANRGEEAISPRLNNDLQRGLGIAIFTHKNSLANLPQEASNWQVIVMKPAVQSYLQQAELEQQQQEEAEAEATAETQQAQAQAQAQQPHAYAQQTQTQQAQTQDQSYTQAQPQQTYGRNQQTQSQQQAQSVGPTGVYASPEAAQYDYNRAMAMANQYGYIPTQYNTTDPMISVAQPLRTTTAQNAAAADYLAQQDALFRNNIRSLLTPQQQAAATAQTQGQANPQQPLQLTTGQIIQNNQQPPDGALVAPYNSNPVLPPDAAAAQIPTVVGTSQQFMMPQQGMIQDAEFTEVPQTDTSNKEKSKKESFNYNLNEGSMNKKVNLQSVCECLTDDLTWLISDGLCSTPECDGESICLDCCPELEIMNQVRDILKNHCRNKNLDLDDDGYVFTLKCNGQDCKAEYKSLNDYDQFSFGDLDDLNAEDFDDDYSVDRENYKADYCDAKCEDTYLIDNDATVLDAKFDNKQYTDLYDTLDRMKIGESFEYSDPSNFYLNKPGCITKISPNCLCDTTTNEKMGITDAINAIMNGVDCGFNYKFKPSSVIECSKDFPYIPTDDCLNNLTFKRYSTNDGIDIKSITDLAELYTYYHAALLLRWSALKAEIEELADCNDGCCDADPNVLNKITKEYNNRHDKNRVEPNSYICADIDDDLDYDLEEDLNNNSLIKDLSKNQKAAAINILNKPNVKADDAIRQLKLDNLMNNPSTPKVVKDAISDKNTDRS